MYLVAFHSDYYNIQCWYAVKLWRSKHVVDTVIITLCGGKEQVATTTIAKMHQVDDVR